MNEASQSCSCLAVTTAAAQWLSCQPLQGFCCAQSAHLASAVMRRRLSSVAISVFSHALSLSPPGFCGHKSGTALPPLNRGAEQNPPCLRPIGCVTFCIPFLTRFVIASQAFPCRLIPFPDTALPSPPFPPPSSPAYCRGQTSHPQDRTVASEANSRVFVQTAAFAEKTLKSWPVSLPRDGCGGP